METDEIALPLQYTQTQPAAASAAAAAAMAWLFPHTRREEKGAAPAHGEHGDGGGSFARRASTGGVPCALTVTDEDCTETEAVGPSLAWPPGGPGWDTAPRAGSVPLEIAEMKSESAAGAATEADQMDASVPGPVAMQGGAEHAAHGGLFRAARRRLRFAPTHPFGADRNEVVTEPVTLLPERLAEVDRLVEAARHAEAVPRTVNIARRWTCVAQALLARLNERRSSGFTSDGAWHAVHVQHPDGRDTRSPWLRERVVPRWMNHPTDVSRHIAAGMAVAMRIVMNGQWNVQSLTAHSKGGTVWASLVYSEVPGYRDVHAPRRVQVDWSAVYQARDDDFTPAAAAAAAAAAALPSPAAAVATALSVVEED